MSSPVKSSSCWPWQREKPKPADSPLVKSKPLEHCDLKATAAFRKEFESDGGHIPKTRPFRTNPQTGQMEIAENGPTGVVWKPMVMG